MAKKVRYTQPLFGEANSLGYLILVPGASVLIRQDGVACDVFADNDGAAMTNPVPTGVSVGTAGVDVNGTLLVYLDPGTGYDGVATVGAAVSTFPLPDVSPDVEDVQAPIPSGTFVPADPALAIVYNADGTVQSVTENGIATTYTYNADGTVATSTRLGVTRTYGYTSGNLTSVA